MRAAIAVVALMSFLVASTLDVALAETAAGSFKPDRAGKRAITHKKTRKVQLRSPVPAVPAAPSPVFEERPGPKMGM